MADLTTSLILLHTALSIMALGLGIPATLDLMQSYRPRLGSDLFIAIALCVSLTGLILPLSGLTPSVIFSIIGITTLTAVLVAQHKFNLVGKTSRRIYALSIVLNIYMLCVVALVQMFQKIPMLHAVAPTQEAPAFLIFQLAVLLLFAGLSIIGVPKFVNRAA